MLIPERPHRNSLEIYELSKLGTWHFNSLINSFILGMNFYICSDKNISKQLSYSCNKSYYYIIIIGKI